MILVFSLITAFYIIIISILYVAYNKIKPFKYTTGTPISQFSIIVPFRNEAKNLEALLNSILTIEYPKSLYEIIMVDDDSEDNSVQIIKSFIEYNKDAKISIINTIRQSNAPKKDAIQTAISKAKFKWIITTDADCVVPKLWLQNFDAFIQNKAPKLMVAPVSYKGSNTILDNFQLQDFLSLQTATVGGFGIGNPFLCNGGNLCYSKSIFNELHGFEGNNDIASGDDLFLMEKVVKNYPEDVHFIKTPNATVFTSPEPTLKALFNQRVRWASKTSAYNNVFSKILAFIVLLMNASLVVLFAFAVLELASWNILVVVFTIKFSIDFLFILKSSSFFKQQSSLILYPINSILYPFFIVAVSCSAVFFKYYWKGRQFKK